MSSVSVAATDLQPIVWYVTGWIAPMCLAELNVANLTSLTPSSNVLPVCQDNDQSVSQAMVQPQLQPRTKNCLSERFIHRN